jgi:hypothetical protein
MINRTNHEKVEVPLISKSNNAKKDAVVDAHFYVIGKNGCGEPFELCKGAFEQVSRPQRQYPFCKVTSRPHY